MRALRQLRADVSTVLWTTEQKHTLWAGGETHMSFSSGRTDIPFSLETEQGNHTKTVVLRVLTHAGNLHFSFQQGPFTQRFRPVVTRVPAVVLSMSWFSRLAVTRAWLFALSKLMTEVTVTYSHSGPRPLRISCLTCCCCIAAIVFGFGLLNMARASSRLTSVQIKTTKQFWLWGLAMCLPPRQGLTYACKKNPYVFTPPSVTVDR